MKSENHPPELRSIDSGFALTLSFDIWSLGLILRELISMGSLTKPPTVYSAQLISLQDMMLKPNPRNRPNVDYILRYLTEKESLVGPALPRASVGLGVPLTPIPAEPTKSAGFMSGFSEGLSEMMNRSGTK